MSVASGEFVADHLSGVENKHIQPNGVDLTIRSIFSIKGEAEFYVGDYNKQTRHEVSPVGGTYWRLSEGQYPVVYDHQIQIPDGYVGRVYPRSRLMRCGIHLTSALWDQGYEGIGEGLLRVPQDITAQLEVGMPVAQMVFIEADDADDYDGTHQKERVNVQG